MICLMDLLTINSRRPPKFEDKVANNPVTRAFKCERYLEAKIPLGVKHPKTYQDN